MHRLLWAGPLLSILFTGCAVHKPQEIAPAPTPLPSTWIEQTEPTAEVPLLGKWWQAFGDPRLNSLMERAFASNFELDQAFARLEQAAAVLGATRAGQQPFLNGQAESRRESSPGFLGDNTGTSYRLSLGAGYEVDIWRKLMNRTQAARWDLEASREEIHSLYLTLSARVADLYFLAEEQRAQLALADRNINAFSDTLERVEGRYREGLVPALDVYQSRQNLATARARRPEFSNRLAQAEHALSVLQGRYPGRSAEDMVAELPAVSEQFPAGIPSEFLARRPDIQASFLRLKASDARIAVAIADRFPSFNLLGNYGHQNTAFSTGAIVGTFWSIAVDLAQPILDGGRRTAEVERTRAVFSENMARYHQAVLTAFQEVEDALAANRTTEERIARLEERVNASRDALRLALDRYLQGLSEYLPVLTAQGLQFEAESQLLSARRQLFADRISLARALGGNWMADEMELRLARKGSEI